VAVTFDRGNGVPGHPIRPVHLPPKRWIQTCDRVRQPE
jgi:hypothetical protein